MLRSMNPACTRVGVAGSQPRRRDDGQRPADPGGPHRVARVVRAARHLREAVGHAHRQHRAQREPRLPRIGAPQHEEEAEEGEGGTRMSRGEAMARPAVAQAEAPVRHVVRDAAELGQVPGAARRAALLHQRDQDQADRRQRRGAPAFAPRESGPQRSYGVDQQHHDQARGHPAAALVQEARGHPVVAQREAVRVGEEPHDGEVPPGQVPEHERRQARQRDEPAAPQRRERHRPDGRQDRRRGRTGAELKGGQRMRLHGAQWAPRR